MKLDQKSFTGKSFRPLPELRINEDLNMFCLLTAWGPRNQSAKVLDFLAQNYESFFSDEEKTRAYSKLESLSREENTVRNLLLACNEWIFKELNEEKTGVFAYELFFASFEKGKLTFAQVGQPFVYLDRPGFSLQSLGANLDFSALFAVKGKRLAPLPSALIGLYPDTHFPVFSLPLQPEDRLLFVSRDFIPMEILKTPREQRSLENFLKLLTSENEKSPCWLGQLSV
ncbi:MAG: SpoIIE family protein phosphatase [Oligoflexia bacterium]|nr:SpoIIE family protein phosphatase [Oligoflexia bacterium]